MRAVLEAVHLKSERTISESLETNLKEPQRSSIVYLDDNYSEFSGFWTPAVRSEDIFLTSNEYLEVSLDLDNS